MKVILVRDVAKLGRKGQVCEVPAGHATNFLIPRKLALPATPEHMKRHSAETARHALNETHSEESFRALCDALAKTTIIYTAAANEQGHLFKGIHAADIARRIAEEGFAIAESAIVLPHPIKELGTHRIALEQGSLRGECTLEVVKK